MPDDRRKTIGVKHPRRTMDWLRWSIGACAVTMVVIVFGFGFTATFAADEASGTAVDGRILIALVSILVALGAQTVAIAFFAGGLAARVTSMEKWREEHIKWADKQVERLEKADDTLRSHSGKG